ncbi:MBL fold metallo-hydrolase [Bacillus sp. JJ1609]|uniref:MBL fold metallo-hydrolase n=1 Tax=Bacillus sp. JJ1609 TaxID=3122977 RepID=UPI00300084C2
MKKLIKETDYFSLYLLSDGVYAPIAKPGKGAWSNAGFVDLGDEVIVFDAFSTPSAAHELRFQAEEITGKKVKYLVNSHYHGDHTFGNQAFSDTTIISTSLTRQLNEEKNRIGDLEKEQEEMQQYLLQLKTQIEAEEEQIIKSSLINQYNEMSKVLEDLPKMKIVLPSVLFEDKVVIEGSQRKVELHCLGGGHTPSDSFMYLPEERIAFMGDLVTESLHLPLYDPESFLSILNKVIQMEIETFVPGHGNIGNKGLVDDLIGYLTLLIEKAKEAHLHQKSLEDFLKEFQMPVLYKEWKGVNGINRNLLQVYNFYKTF